jgi:potassium channel subfamily K, other eukaryote
LTVGYGDIFPITALGQALIIPFSLGGLLVLGLVISSIFRAIKEIGEQNIIHHHYDKIRSRTLGRTVTTSLELERKEIERELARERAMAKHAMKGSSRSPHTILHRQTTFDTLTFHKAMAGHSSRQSLSSRPASIMSTASRSSSFTTAMKNKHHILILKEEKDRFNQMRTIQHTADVWKRWVRLGISITVFGIFWCVGAAVFWQLEANTLGMTYWQSVYYGWITLITIGYGDFSPHSVAGRSFFVVWVQFAVPALTVLADNLSLTVVEVFNSSTATVASSLLPRAETLQSLQVKYPNFFSKLPYSIQKRILNRDAAARVLRGFEIGMDDLPGENEPNMTEDDAFAAGVVSPDVSALEEQHRRDLRKAPDAGALARQLALAIKRCALDMHGPNPKQYAFEEWVEFTRLIRFSAIGGHKEAMKDEENEGMVHWDWLAENSPLMSEQKEAEFVLDRLCESLVRYLRRNPPHAPFADAVREKGEEALRLKSGGWNEEEIAEAHEKLSKTQPNNNLDPERRGSQSLFSRLMDRNLQPVVEEDQDIRPVRSA